MLKLMKKNIIVYAGWMVFCLLNPGGREASALEQKPEATAAQWSGINWGIVKIAPRIVKYGQQVHIHGIVVGGPASSPFWSCSQYQAWKANGTGSPIKMNI